MFIFYFLICLKVYSYNKGNCSLMCICIRELQWPPFGVHMQTHVNLPLIMQTDEEVRMQCELMQSFSLSLPIYMAKFSINMEKLFVFIRYNTTCKFYILRDAWQILSPLPFLKNKCKYCMHEPPSWMIVYGCICKVSRLALRMKYCLFIC